MTEYYHTLLEKGGRILRDGEVVQETDYQILGHKKNEAQTPPEKKWLGWKKAQGFPHPTFVRMPEASCQMTTDEIIKLAREAGLGESLTHNGGALRALAHEIWTAAQLAPGEGAMDGVARVEALLRKAAHPAITHCDNCGCDWLDNGLNPVGCPYCKQTASVDEVKEPDLWRCTVCGRVGTVGRCCGEETREPVNHAVLSEGNSND